MNKPKTKQSPHSFPHYGEIYLVYFNPKKGKEVGKIRPVLVISNDIQNEYDHHIIVAPISDEDWENLAEIQHFEVLIKANATNGLKKDSKILLNRLRAIDVKLRLRDYVGVASKGILEQVNKGDKLGVDKSNFVEHQAPQQLNPDGTYNGDDCGVYVIAITEFLINDKEAQEIKKNVPLFRKMLEEGKDYFADLATETTSKRDNELDQIRGIIASVQTIFDKSKATKEEVEQAISSLRTLSTAASGLTEKLNKQNIANPPNSNNTIPQTETKPEGEKEKPNSGKDNINSDETSNDNNNKPKPTPSSDQPLEDKVQQDIQQEKGEIKNSLKNDIKQAKNGTDEDKFNAIKNSGKVLGEKGFEEEKSELATIEEELAINNPSKYLEAILAKIEENLKKNKLTIEELDNEIQADYQNIKDNKDIANKVNENISKKGAKKRFEKIKAEVSKVAKISKAKVKKMKEKLLKFIHSSNKYEQEYKKQAQNLLVQLEKVSQSQQPKSAEIKRVNKSDLKAFLTQDHTSFTVLSVSCKHIESTDRISITLSKNSAQSFYLDQAKKTKPVELATPKTKPDDCLQDAQNSTNFDPQAEPLKVKIEKVPSTIKISPPAEIVEPIFPNYDLMVESKHGLKDKKRTYRFYLNLYEYESKPALLIAKHKLDAATGQPLAKNQKIFRQFNYQTQQTTYFYRTNEQLVGQVANPLLIKKNYRLGTRSLNPLNLLTLATKHAKKELYQFKKPKKPAVQHDFQEFLITRLLLLCAKAEFCHLPLEQERVSKEQGTCDQLPYTHFQTKPVLRFTFLPAQASIIRTFIANLDTYASEFDLEESKDFNAYPIIHNPKHETIKSLNGLCDLTEIEVYTREVSEGYKQKELVFRYLTKGSLLEKNFKEGSMQKHLKKNQGFGKVPKAFQTPCPLSPQQTVRNNHHQSEGNTEDFASSKWNVCWNHLSQVRAKTVSRSLLPLALAWCSPPRL
ncbi:8405_t:CDS:10, partial [Funneliformis geosporum]